MEDKRQYINVTRNSTSYLIRELVNGHEVFRKERIAPVLFTPTMNKTDYRDFYNKTYLEEHQFDSVGEMKEFVENNKSFENELWGSNDLVTQYLYYANYNEKDNSKIKISFLDIEVCTREKVGDEWIDGGFPLAEDAKFPINAICDYRSDTKKYHVFTTAPGWEKEKSQLKFADEVEYHYCKNETELLKKWFSFYKTNLPHVITGWNCIDKNSNIWQENKIVKLNDIISNDILLDSSVINKFPLTKKNGYEIELINGQKIIASKDHIFPVYKKRIEEYTNFNKKDVIDMTVEDIMSDTDNQHFVIVPKHNNKNSDVTFRDIFVDNIDKLKTISRFNEYDLLNSEKCTFNMSSRVHFEVDLNKVISNEMFHLFGLFFTDGSRTKDGDTLTFSNTHIPLLEYVTQLNVYKKFGPKSEDKKYYLLENKNGKWYSYKVTGFSEFGLLLYCLCYDINNKKKLNVQSLSMLSSKQFNSFLSGLIDGDGSVGNDGSISFCNFDGNIQSLQELLLWNDYMVSAYNLTNIYFHKCDIDKLKNNLNLIHEKKKNNLLSNCGSSLYRKTSAKIINYRELDNYYVVKIKSITDLNTEYEMYDIETDTHYFYANGIKTHNCKTFDMPYIINRFKNLYGEDKASGLSPWNKVVLRSETTAFGSVEYYQIYGVNILDYLDLYKKYRYVPREKYTLDYISRCENPDDVKLRFEGTHGSLYYDDPVFFVDYNIQDVRCVVCFERDLKFISLVCYLSYFSGINFEDNYSPVKVWETLIYRYAMDNKKVVPFKTRDREIKKESYEGAYVHPPVPGLKHAIASFDYTSLYPSIMRLWYTGDDVHQKGEDRQKLYDGLMNVMKNDKNCTEMYKEIVQTGIFNEFYINNDIPVSVTEYLKENGVSLTTNCEFFDVSRKSIMIDLIANLFKERKADKKTSFNYKHEAQDILEELNRRGVKI